MNLDYEQWGYGPPHPGEVLREQILPRITLSKGELARHLGISRNTLDDLLGARSPVTLDMATRLGKAFGNGPRYWLALQMQHDVWSSEREGGPEIAPIALRAGMEARAAAAR